MTRRCSGKEGKGCARFLAEWYNYSLCFSCNDCSNDSPCDVCSSWSTLQWEQASVATAKSVKRTSKGGKDVQQDVSSRGLSSSEGPSVSSGQ